MSIEQYKTVAPLKSRLLYPPYGEIKTFQTEDRLYVGYLSLDTEPLPFEWDFESSGLFEIFKDEDSLQMYAQAHWEAGRMYYRVDRYKHGLVNYSISNTKHYPDRAWDVVPCAIYVPPQDLQESHKLGQINDKDLIDFGNKILESYSHWCNGEVYRVVFETWKSLGNRLWERIDEESYWDVVGHRLAEQTLKEQMAHYQSLEEA